MITVTEAAAEQMKKLIADDDDSEKVIGMRLAVKGGGCAGMMYDMEMIEESRNADKTLEAYGVTIYIDTKSYLFLQGVTVDYVKNMMGSMFVFDNPGTSGCGCGTSFSPKE